MNLGDFLTYVKLDFKRTDKDTELTQYYNDAIMWVAAHMPHANYKYQSYVALVRGTEDYALPCDLLHLLHPIKFIIGSGASDSGYNLIRISKEEYNAIEPNPNRSSPSLGRPIKYTVYSRSVLLTPVPDSSDALLEIDWTKKPTDLSSADQTPMLGTSWEEVLKWATLERAYAALGLTQEAEFWGTKYHAIGPNGEDVPTGMCKTLFDIEKDREFNSIGQVKFNAL